MSESTLDNTGAPPSRCTSTEMSSDDDAASLVARTTADDELPAWRGWGSRTLSRQEPPALSGAGRRAVRVQ